MFAEKLNEQDGVCAICGQLPRGTGRNGFVVDHDHNNGLVRGILCADCNKGLGNFKDNSNVLRLAAKYLEAKLG